MTFVVQGGWLDGWDNAQHRVETLGNAALLAEELDYDDHRLVRVLDENGNDLHFYSNAFELAAERASREYWRKACTQRALNRVWLRK